MSYRNGTYIAFHANSTTEPTESDMKYYNLLKAWKVRDDDDFSFANSHEKTAAVRDSSMRQTLRERLVTRLRNSKHVLLIIGKTTKEDTDWIPFEIQYAIDTCQLPIIAAYTTTDQPIRQPRNLSSLWPAALSKRIEDGTAGVIHIPFKKAPIRDAISQFGPSKFPNDGGLGYYSDDAYRSFGML